MKSNFARICWGPAPPPDIDVGTDMWVQAVDERDDVLRRLVGVQVKTVQVLSSSLVRRTARLAGGITNLRRTALKIGRTTTPHISSSCTI